MKVQTLKGFRDYSPEEMLVRQALIGRVQKVFESFGYAPLHTPALEYAQLLLGNYGDEGEKLLYKFQDHGKRMVALRYDLTVPLARYVGMNSSMRFPFRRYQIAPVWRAERPQKGRFREFYQCDVDLVGIDSAQADAECILVDHAVMQALEIEGYRIMINHRGFLDGLLEHLAIPTDKVVGAMRILDKVDKVSAAAMGEMLTTEGLTEAQVDGLTGLSAIDGPNEDRIAQALELAGNHPKAVAGLERLQQALEMVAVTVGEAPVFFAPAIARGLDYYTGIVYETFLPDRYGVGSVMSGGRYNELLGTFAGKDIPAVGISLGIDRLLSALAAAGEQESIAVSEILVSTIKGAETGACKVAGILRAGLAQQGTGIELFPRPQKLKKQMDYAHKKGISIVVLPGPEELEEGKVTVRHMGTGEQIKVSLEDLVAQVERLLEG